MDAYSHPTTNISISSLSTIFEQILCCTKIGQLFNIPIFRMFQTLVGAMQKIWNNSESRSLSSRLKWKFWSVWNFQICNLDMKILENIVAVMWNLWISAKMLLFPPTNFTSYWSLDGQYSRLSHRFYTYPTPIMAGAEPRDFCSQYPFGGEGFRPNAFTCDIYCVIYVDDGLVIKIQTLDQSKLTLSFYY